MKYAAAVSTLVCAALAQPALAQIERSTMLGVAPSVLKVEAVSAEGRFQLGSGVVVRRGKVITNCHVTRKAQRIDVVRAGVRWPVARQSTDIDKDLCLLDVPRLEGEGVPIGRSLELKPAQDVVALGYTGGVGVQLSDGDVVALHPYRGSAVVQTSNWFSSGASGGGLFNAAGELIGILTFRLRGGSKHYFAAPADWALAMLDDEARFAAVAPIAGQSYWELPIDSQPYFLQAAALEQGRQWEALDQLALRWMREEPGDPEPLHLRGVAREALGETDAAQRHYKQSLVLDPGYSRSWARLAYLYKREGQLGEARSAIAKLAALDPKQAREIAAELEKP
ncbi:MAG TPA: trypsin-like peptidase domain-containing protein [Methylibium sp.]|uniref:S1 family peptidase n=1 Tax=Methylibium sp. TaxID=2067992 RepID=UPI002DBE11FC|nr:trypsin-like peptidase domain-containing protein [Methylibium sp.]HEU4460934.1 trypsin-like peptidase domain-containing protein [Methylibium sp.]